MDNASIGHKGGKNAEFTKRFLQPRGVGLPTTIILNEDNFMIAEEIAYLKELCLQFRNAIVAYGIKKLPISFHEFPMGSCGDASLLLGKYFEEMGLGQFDYVCGELGRQSHA